MAVKFGLGRLPKKKNPGCAGSAKTGGAFRSRSPNSPKPNCPMYWTPALRLLENSCSTPKFTLRISGLRKFEAMGRMRPNGGTPSGGVTAASAAGLGVFGNAANTAGLVVVMVFNVVPSKLSESNTTLLKASMVDSANESRNRVLSHGA